MLKRRKSSLRRLRIGVDLDGKDRLRLLMAYFNGCLIGRVEAYETGQGFHVKVWLDREWRPEEDLAARMLLGDDPMRLEWDEWRIRRGLIGWVDTLFEFKRDLRTGKVTGEQPLDFRSLVAPHFWSRFQRGSYVCRLSGR